MSEPSPMIKYEVKKLGVGGVLDQAIAVLRDHFGVLLITSLIVVVPLALVNVVVAYWLQPQIPPEPRSPDELVEFYEAIFTPLLPLIPLWIILAFIASPLSYGAVVYAASQFYLGGAVTFKSGWKRAFERKWALIGTWLLYTILLTVGMFLCMVPYFIFLFWFFVFVQVVVLERRGGGGALERSKSLMSGHYGEAIILSLIVFFITTALSMFSHLFSNRLLAGILQIIVQSAMMTVGAVATTVFYYSCRSDRDGFDLLWLADMVAAPDEPAPDANQLW
ncbi:hypothetical protein [Lacipirellula parvula]|uniref:Glycerophosphoryl diester phosphodiesterase membrane domain-containing protein n=1 Tax=Lacipirellula parvula TaxID=2650471 RepID=A0A5K7XI95_9BACT|nr:hypothetical protein [Lacipirellula parvula]BBO34681.1 hypothetical protein PLANPX_4293 [Lacipirellula parvula]